MQKNNIAILPVLLFFIYSLLLSGLFLLENYVLRLLLFICVETSLLFICSYFMKLRFYNNKWEGRMDSFLSGLYNSRINAQENPLFSQIGEAINKVMESYQELHIKQFDFQQNRKDFLTEITHDIRTPLTSIIGYTQALKDNLNLTEGEKQKYLEVVNLKAQDLKEHMEQLFLLARSDSQEIVYKQEKLNFAELLRSTLLAFYPRFQEQKQEPNIIISSESFFILADKISIIRMINNLMENHFRYSFQNSLEIKLIKHNNSAVLHFKTFNKRLPEKLVQQLNSQFKDQVSFLGPLGHGTGLGLPIAKALILANSGSLKVENQHNDFCFTISFPIVS